MPAAWAGVAVAAGSAIAKGVAGSGASDAVSGASAQASALDAAARQEGKDNLAYDRGNAQPYITTGQNALMHYADLTGVNGADAATSAMAGFQSSPGFQYQLQQGLRAVDNGAAATGMLRSGATLKAEQTLGNNLAGQDFTSYLGRLNTLAGYGIQGAALDNQSTASYNNLLTKTTTDQTNNLTGAGTQQASIYGNTVGGISDAIGSGVGIARQNGLLNFGKTDAFGGAGANFSASGSGVASAGSGLGGAFDVGY